MVNAWLTIFMRQSARASVYPNAMNAPFIHGRGALADASDLIDRFGANAMFEAAALAERSRDQGNVVRFCHWRQIQRVIAVLSSDEVFGPVH